MRPAQLEPSKTDTRVKSCPHAFPALQKHTYDVRMGEEIVPPGDDDEGDEPHERVPIG